MKAHFIVRFISLVFYFSISLMGMMLAVPFICYLFLTPLFDWTTPIQPLTSLAALFGLGVLLSTYIPKIRRFNCPGESFIFILLLLPIAERLISVPLAMFGYATFIIPLVVFLILYPISIFLRQKAKADDTNLE